MQKYPIFRKYCVPIGFCFYCKIKNACQLMLMYLRKHRSIVCLSHLKIVV